MFAPQQKLAQQRIFVPQQDCVSHAVEDLAKEFALPLPQVDQLVNAKMHDLEQRARIKQFVVLLALKQVKDVLRANLKRTLHDLEPSQQSMMVENA